MVYDFTTEQPIHVCKIYRNIYAVTIWHINISKDPVTATGRNQLIAPETPQKCLLQDSDSQRNSDDRK